MANRDTKKNICYSAIENSSKCTIQDLRVFVACVFLATLTTGWTITYAIGVLTTLEKRYQWSNTELGILTSMPHAGTLSTIPFISYFLGRPRCHRPRWVGVGVLIMGLGCIVTMLPQFLGDKYEYTPVSNVTSIGNSSRATGMCQEDIPPPGDSSCDAEDAESFTRDINMAFYIGYFLAGMGYAPVPTIGVSYIDDYAGKKSPVYIGLIESTWGIGMPCGFLLSAAVLLVYVDFYRVDMATVDLETSDHRWVGAWWIGFAIGAVVFILAALPLFCFPRRLNCKPRITSGVNNGNTVDENEDKIHILADVKGFFYSVWLILTNPVFMLTNLAYSIDKPVGIVLFLPKYFVKDLYYSVSMSNVLMGVIWLFPLSPGRLFSGLLIKKLNIGLNGFAKMCCIAALTTLTLLSLMVPFSCEGETLANTGQDSNTNMIIPGCNGDCHCSTDHFQPICGANNLTYFSPCFAGCTRRIDDGFDGCTCVSLMNDTLSPTTYSIPETASFGYCSYETCQFAIVFLVLMFLSAMSTASTSVPTILLSMKAVNTELKSLALGFRYIMLRVLSNIPGPIVSGYLLDSTCTQWQTKCGKRGACVAYDNYRFRMIMIGMNILLTGLAFFFYVILAMFLRHRRKHAATGERKFTNSVTDDEGNELQIIGS